MSSFYFVQSWFDDSFIFSRSIVTIKLVKTEQSHANFRSRFFLILQHYTFYDFIINKARGKSGPLFSFDVHEDVRMISDASVEKDEVSKTAVTPKSTMIIYFGQLNQSKLQ